MDSQSFASLLKDVAQLLRPVPVVMVDDASNTSRESASQHQNTLLALSDLHALFSSNSASMTRRMPRTDHISAKIAFYAGQVLSTDTDFFEGLAEEVGVRADREDRQQQEIPTSENRRPAPLKEEPRRVRIVELE